MAIRASLQKGELCRVYKETLTACWPNITSELRGEKVAHFAAQNHWMVGFRDLGHLGIVAEFRKADVASHV